MAERLENPKMYQYLRVFAFRKVHLKIDIRRQKKPKGDRNVSVLTL